MVNNTDQTATAYLFATDGYDMYLGTVSPGESRNFSDYWIVVNIK